MTSTRPTLLQLRAECNKPAVWLPATPGLWSFSPIREGPRAWLVGDPKLLLVRGCGPRGDDGLCIVVTLDPEGNARPSDEIKSVRELAGGVWTFLRPLKPDDPTWKGAE